MESTHSPPNFLDEIEAMWAKNCNRRFVDSDSWRMKILENNGRYARHRRKGELLNVILVAVENLALGFLAPNQIAKAIWRAKSDLSRQKPLLQIFDVLRTIEGCTQSGFNCFERGVMKGVRERLNKYNSVPTKPLKPTQDKLKRRVEPR
jgi:hypothetical protein